MRVNYHIRIKLKEENLKYEIKINGKKCEYPTKFLYTAEYLYVCYFN